MHKLFQKLYGNFSNFFTVLFIHGKKGTWIIHRGTWITHGGTRKITVCSSKFYDVNSNRQLIKNYL